MKIVAITACTSGIAHTYLAKDRLEISALELGIDMKIETQGALGIRNRLDAKEIETADVVLIAADIDIKEKSRFQGKRVYNIPINKVVRLSKVILEKIKQEYEAS